MHKPREQITESQRGILEGIDFTREEIENLINEFGANEVGALADELNETGGKELAKLLKDFIESQEEEIDFYRKTIQDTLKKIGAFNPFKWEKEGPDLSGDERTVKSKLSGLLKTIKGRHERTPLTAQQRRTLLRKMDEIREGHEDSAITSNANEITKQMQMVYPEGVDETSRSIIIITLQNLAEDPQGEDFAGVKDWIERVQANFPKHGAIQDLASDALKAMGFTPATKPEGKDETDEPEVVEKTLSFTWGGDRFEFALHEPTLLNENLDALLDKIHARKAHLTQAQKKTLKRQMNEIKNQSEDAKAKEKAKTISSRLELEYSQRVEDREIILNTLFRLAEPPKPTGVQLRLAEQWLDKIKGKNEFSTDTEIMTLLETAENYLKGEIGDPPEEPMKPEPAEPGSRDVDDEPTPESGDGDAGERDDDPDGPQAPEVETVALSITIDGTSYPVRINPNHSAYTVDDLAKVETALKDNPNDHSWAVNQLLHDFSPHNIEHDLQKNKEINTLIQWLDEYLLQKLEEKLRAEQAVQHWLENETVALFNRLIVLANGHRTLQQYLEALQYILTDTSTNPSSKQRRAIFKPWTVNLLTQIVSRIDRESIDQFNDLGSTVEEESFIVDQLNAATEPEDAVRGHNIPQTLRSAFAEKQEKERQIATRKTREAAQALLVYGNRENLFSTLAALPGVDESIKQALVFWQEVLTTGRAHPQYAVLQGQAVDLMEKIVSGLEINHGLTIVENVNPLQVIQNVSDWRQQDFIFNQLSNKLQETSVKGALDTVQQAKADETAENVLTQRDNLVDAFIGMAGTTGAAEDWARVRYIFNDGLATGKPEAQARAALVEEKIGEWTPELLLMLNNRGVDILGMADALNVLQNMDQGHKNTAMRFLGRKLETHEVKEALKEADAQKETEAQEVLDQAERDHAPEKADVENLLTDLVTNKFSMGTETYRKLVAIQVIINGNPTNPDEQDTQRDFIDWGKTLLIETARELKKGSDDDIRLISANDKTDLIVKAVDEQADTVRQVTKKEIIKLETSADNANYLAEKREQLAENAHEAPSETQASDLAKKLKALSHLSTEDQRALLTLERIFAEPSVDSKIALQMVDAVLTQIVMAEQGIRKEEVSYMSIADKLQIVDDAIADHPEKLSKPIQQALVDLLAVDENRRYFEQSTDKLSEKAAESAQASPDQIRTLIDELLQPGIDGEISSKLEIIQYGLNNAPMDPSDKKQTLARSYFSELGQKLLTDIFKKLKERTGEDVNYIKAGAKLSTIQAIFDPKKPDTSEGPKIMGVVAGVIKKLEDEEKAHFDVIQEEWDKQRQEAVKSNPPTAAEIGEIATKLAEVAPEYRHELEALKKLATGTALTRTSLKTGEQDQFVRLWFRLTTDIEEASGGDPRLVSFTPINYRVENIKNLSQKSYQFVKEQALDPLLDPSSSSGLAGRPRALMEAEIKANETARKTAALSSTPAAKQWAQIEQWHTGSDEDSKKLAALVSLAKGEAFIQGNPAYRQQIEELCKEALFYTLPNALLMAVPDANAQAIEGMVLNTKLGEIEKLAESDALKAVLHNGLNHSSIKTVLENLIAGAPEPILPGDKAKIDAIQTYANNIQQQMDGLSVSDPDRKRLEERLQKLYESLPLHIAQHVDPNGRFSKCESKLQAAASATALADMENELEELRVDLEWVGQPEKAERDQIISWLADKRLKAWVGLGSGEYYIKGDAPTREQARRSCNQALVLTLVNQLAEKLEITDREKLDFAGKVAAIDAQKTAKGEEIQKIFKNVFDKKLPDGLKKLIEESAKTLPEKSLYNQEIEYELNEIRKNIVASSAPDELKQEMHGLIQELQSIIVECINSNPNEKSLYQEYEKKLKSMATTASKADLEDLKETTKQRKSPTSDQREQILKWVKSDKQKPRMRALARIASGESFLKGKSADHALALNQACAQGMVRDLPNKILEKLDWNKEKLNNTTFEDKLAAVESATDDSRVQIAIAETLDEIDNKNGKILTEVAHALPKENFEEVETITNEIWQQVKACELPQADTQEIHELIEQIYEGRPRYFANMRDKEARKRSMERHHDKLRKILTIAQGHARSIYSPTISTTVDALKTAAAKNLKKQLRPPAENVKKHIPEVRAA